MLGTPCASPGQIQAPPGPLALAQLHQLCGHGQGVTIQEPGGI